ncbi:MAG: pyridoxamine 5'-phosphate oxidase, partial [bacterium]|nr:pyridoxamine 5'-phosphate oxidase [Candidatus Aquidulcis sp.]
MSNEPLGDRSNYQRGRLDANDLLPDPVNLFHRWVNEAIAEQIPEPLAAALATADSAGNPSVRMILIRGIGPAGIDFYTNHESRKGRDLAARPTAALTIWWPTLE